MALSDRIPYQAIVDRPKLKLPNGKRMAVWVCVNIEEWRIEGPMPRMVLSRLWDNHCFQMYQIGHGMNMECELVSGGNSRLLQIEI